MAQTTCLASFGPVFINVTFYLPSYRVFGSLQLVYTVKYYLVTKKLKEKRNTLTNGPNDASGVVWARFRYHQLPLPFLSRIR